MIDTLTTYSLQHFTQFAGYFIVAIIVGLIVNKVTIFWCKTNQANAKLPRFEDLLNKIHLGFEKLNTVLLEKNIISQSCYSRESSPRVLNLLGHKLYKESGADKVFEGMKGTLLSALGQKKIDSLLEIERESLDVFLDRMNTPEFKDLQNFAFQHPTFEGSPLTYTDILFVMALRLRDLYLSEHPELK